MHTLCGKPKAVYVDNFGYIRGWDLLLLEDELRQEMCPYTGGYYYLLRDKKQEPEGCCAEKPPTEEDIELEDDELKEGWQVGDLYPNPNPNPNPNSNSNRNHYPNHDSNPNQP